MLKEIVSISGKPGLFKLVSQGKNMLIVASLADGAKIPAFAKDKVVSLGDIAIFTETDEIPLGEVLEKLKLKENGAEASIDPKSDNDTLRKYLAEILPDFDRDRVYPSDIRKLVSWYNILINNKMTDFVEKKDEAVTEDDGAKKEAKEVKKTAAKSTSTKSAPKVKATQSKVASTVRNNRSNRGV